MKAQAERGVESARCCGRNFPMAQRVGSVFHSSVYAGAG
jgi:hypothetical protein